MTDKTIEVEKIPLSKELKKTLLNHRQQIELSLPMELKKENQARVIADSILMFEILMYLANENSYSHKEMIILAKTFMSGIHDELVHFIDRAQSLNEEQKNIAKKEMRDFFNRNISRKE